MLTITLKQTKAGKCRIVILENEVEVVKRILDINLGYEVVDRLPTMIKCNCFSLHPNLVKPTKRNGKSKG